MRPDWASQMHRVFAEHKGREFAWGVDDCCLFVARVEDAMTDGSREAQFKSAYHDEISALRVIATHGSLSQALAFYLGEPTTERATRGDIVTIEGGEGESAGICNGSTVVAMGKKGLMSVPRNQILKVWKWRK